MTHESQNKSQENLCVCMYSIVRGKFAVSHAHILQTLKGQGNIMNNFMQIETLDEMDKFFENHNLKKNWF